MDQQPHHHNERHHDQRHHDQRHHDRPTTDPSTSREWLDAFNRAASLIWPALSAQQWMAMRKWPRR